MGANDVIPFVPISGVTMRVCSLRRVRRTDVERAPGSVYLYEKAAARPSARIWQRFERASSRIRDEIGTNAARRPDSATDESIPPQASRSWRAAP